MSEAAPWLLGNVAAEEQRSGPMNPHASAVARLLALSLPRGARLLRQGAPEPLEDFWPEALGALPAEPAFGWLADAQDHAWLPTAEAVALLREHGRGPLSPEPAVVAAVHDKAFTQRTCEAEALEPRLLRGLSRVLEPGELDDPTLVEQLQAHVDAWPAWTGGRFALKPRFGSSGRGRVPGEGGRLDVDSVRGALPRLAARGGAILEPWLAREQDLSVQLHLSRSGELTLLGTLVQHMSAAGVYRGHSGRIDHRGRVTSGTRHDDGLLDAALPLARAAHALGFHGPCGVDAFSFRADERLLLRPAVELNARFTTGTVLVGLVRRALPHFAARLGLGPGAPRYFYFALQAPAQGWPTPVPGLLELVPLRAAVQDVAPDLAPALVLADSAERLAELTGA